MITRTKDSSYKPSPMNKQLSIIAGFLLAVTLLAGCAGTSGMKEVQVDTLIPAEVILPSSIDKLLIVDRTVYTGNPFDSNEAIPTNAVPGEANDAVQLFLIYFFRYLGGSPRFESVVATEMLTGNSLNREFPRPIPWAIVNDLCRRYQADALVAIEVYSSDFNVSNPRRPSSAQQSILDDPQQSQFSVRGAGNVIFGFRVYHPDTETIIDEELYRHDETWDATGPDPAQAAVTLIRREQAIGELIHLAAAEYARKIAPVYVPVARKYFGESAKVPALVTGSQLAEEGKWQEAADTWEAGISQAPEREAGQLAYNVAIAYEALRNPDLAREWAEKASVEYGNGQAKAYLAELDGQRSLLERAKEQLRGSGGVQLPGVQIQ